MSIKTKKKVDGFLLLDKPINFSSNQILQEVRYLFNAKKAGHTGTLDPLATGMLPICFGEATKFAKFLINSDKRYIVIAKLGQKTDTFDSQGKIIDEKKINLNENQIKDILKNFQGNLFQTPPMYSSIKYKSKPLYKYAKKGIIIKRKERKIKIYDLKFKKFKKDKLKLDIFCSKGTYIRTLIDDLGKMLGCGAHVIYLRRLQVSNYLNENMITLQKLYSIKKKFQFQKKIFYKKMNKLLYPVSKLVDHFSEINLSKTNAKNLKKGQSIFIKNNFKIGETIRITEGDEKKFIGIAKINKEKKIQPFRMIINN